MVQLNPSATPVFLLRQEKRLHDILSFTQVITCTGRRSDRENFDSCHHSDYLYMNARIYLTSYLSRLVFSDTLLWSQDKLQSVGVCRRKYEFQFNIICKATRMEVRPYCSSRLRTKYLSAVAEEVYIVSACKKRTNTYVSIL